MFRIKVSKMLLLILKRNFPGSLPVKLRKMRSAKFLNKIGFIPNN